MTDYIKREDAINVFCWGEDLYVRCGIATQNIKDIPSADVRENVKAEWEFTDHAYTVHCKRCRYKHNRASQYCPECGAYMTNGTKWFGTDDER